MNHTGYRSFTGPLLQLRRCRRRCQRGCYRSQPPPPPAPLELPMEDIRVTRTAIVAARHQAQAADASMGLSFAPRRFVRGSFRARASAVTSTVAVAAVLFCSTGACHSVDCPSKRFSV